MFKFIIVSDTHGADLSRLYTAICQLIAKDHRESPTIKHILVMTGDVFSTNKLLSATSNGNFDIDAMSALAELFPPDNRLFVPGNHDYTYTEEQLIKLTTKAKFQVIISNVTFNDQSKLQYVERFCLKDGGNEISFGGLMTSETILNNANAKQVITKIDAEYQFLEPQPDVVISHLGLLDDLRRPDSGHTFGGHTHKAEIRQLNCPGSNKARYVINGGAFAEALITISMDTNNKKIIGSTMPSTAEFEPSPVITTITKFYEKTLENKLKLPAETLSRQVCAFSSGIRPSGLDLAPEEVKETKSHLRITDTVITRITADALANKFGCIALFPAAGIRGNFKAGQKLTYLELFETFVTGNKIVILSLTGKELIEGLAKGILHSYRYWRGRGRILHPSKELVYEYDINQENPGDVIRSVTINGQPIDPDKTYEIVTTDWAANYCFPTDKIVFANNNAKTDPHILVKTVASYINGKTLVENFSKRIKCPQSLQFQEDLLPTLDRANGEVKVESFNIDHHRKLHENHKKIGAIGKDTLHLPSDSPIRAGERTVTSSTKQSSASTKPLFPPSPS